MEQIQQLLEVLKDTPQMALWGLGLFFLFTLIKLASWVTALTFVVKLFIKRFFDYKDSSVINERSKGVSDFFEKNTMSSVDYSLLLELISELKQDGFDHIFSSDLRQAILHLKKMKKNED